MSDKLNWISQIRPTHRLKSVPVKFLYGWRLIGCISAPPHHADLPEARKLIDVYLCTASPFNPSEWKYGVFFNYGGGSVMPYLGIEDIGKVMQHSHSEHFMFALPHIMEAMEDDRRKNP